MPAFAPQTFKAWFGQREKHNEGKPQVVLWPDTFSNHFHPDAAKAAVEVLEAAGLQVLVPAMSLCCGRPLYDFGMLDTAKNQLSEILVALQPWIEAGIPVVGLEPSCVAVFRDELVNLFPQDEGAKRLNQQTFLLSEFLNQKVKTYQPPQLHRKALVHAHCHHRAIMTTFDEEAILKKLGMDFELLNDGCCGMAGSFGFEREHYDISIAVGERGLLPAVRRASKDTLIVTNGFSCHEQIEQTTDRRPLHLAQVIQMALHQGAGAAPEDYPEKRQLPATVWSLGGVRLQKKEVLLGAGLLLGGLLAWRLMKRGSA